ncbi:hypothetical protein M6G65_33365 (plasmid) [Methylobacterium tardum]|uniref:hypothetical protein n=1 Tax=Methylobacterium tardum TaxID=374432 RepID=UPI0020205270|nr:hypothetical protein [Methylobacterium tardum]URD40287.1 hypothetical protein M6G65_33365 [Methylobacterium tardum]
MGDVLTFTPRPKPIAPEALEPLAGSALRASLEEAAQIALDAADRIIAVLDRMDGDAGAGERKCETISLLENGFRFAEPDLSIHARPVSTWGEQSGRAWRSAERRRGRARPTCHSVQQSLPTNAARAFRCGDAQDPEEELPETVLPEVPAILTTEAEILPWRGRGNVIAAAGAFLADLLERA